MTRAGVLWPIPLLVCLAACGGGEGSGAPQGSADTMSPAPTLEQAAIDAGIVANASAVPPIGLYRNRHEAGTDSLCVVPGAAGELRFGLDAVFGEGIACQGSGTARRSGDKLILNFARSACIVVADYDGDRVALPGVVDVECRKLCTERGSLEGVSFPRVSRSESVARDARDRNRSPLCF